MSLWIIRFRLFKMHVLVLELLFRSQNRVVEKYHKHRTGKKVYAPATWHEQRVHYISSQYSRPAFTAPCKKFYNDCTIFSAMKTENNNILTINWKLENWWTEKPDRVARISKCSLADSDNLHPRGARKSWFKMTTDKCTHPLRTSRTYRTRRPAYTDLPGIIYRVSRDTTRKHANNDCGFTGCLMRIMNRSQ